VRKISFNFQALENKRYFTTKFLVLKIVWDLIWDRFLARKKNWKNATVKI
jgi:hypothetical protein